jgi:hypothetical protein
MNNKAGHDDSGKAPRDDDSPLDEIPAHETLGVEQCGEVGVLDARVRAPGHLGLGAIGDAEAGGLQHRKIVGAVADRQRVVELKPLAAAISLSAASLAPSPRIGSLTLPLSLPPSIMSVLARSSSAPIRSPMARVNWRKPPETITT